MPAGRPTIRTDENREKYLACLRTGVGFKKAAQAIGVHYDSLLEWRKEDAEFSDQCNIADSERVKDIADFYTKFAARGEPMDVRAMSAWARACEFVLSRRAGKAWRERHIVEEEESPNVEKLLSKLCELEAANGKPGDNGSESPKSRLPT